MTSRLSSLVGAALLAFSSATFAITQVSENCQPDPNYGSNGVLKTTSSGTLRSGDSRPGNLVTTSVTLDRYESQYVCKNTELASNFQDCGDNNENLKGSVVEQNCVAKLSGTDICVQDLYKWVDQPRKQETHENLDLAGEAGDTFCANVNEVCSKQWGTYCLEGNYTKRCNLPFSECGIDILPEEQCTSLGWKCSSWSPDYPNQICRQVDYSWSCKIGEDQCLRYETHDTCTGITIPDFSYGDDPTKDNGFGEAVKAAHIVQAIKNEFDVAKDGKIRLFKGEALGCSKFYIPTYCNCCGSAAEKQYKCDFGSLSDCLGQLFCSCTQNEAKLWIANQRGVTTMVVSNDWAMLEPDQLLYSDKYSRFGSIQGFFGCPDWLLDRRRNYFCRWNSKIARIIQEQGRIQLRELSGRSVQYEKGDVRVRRFADPDGSAASTGQWVYLGDRWGLRKYWLWQYPSNCASGHGSPLECPVDNSLFIAVCDKDRGCSMSWSPSVSPMQKRSYPAEKATIVNLQANSGAYHPVDSKTFAKVDCSAESCLIKWHAFSRLTPISSVGWAYEYLYYPKKWNSGINVNDVWIEPLSFGNDYPPLDSNPFTKIRYSTQGIPDPNNPQDYTEVSLLIKPDGELVAEDASLNDSNGIVLPNGVHAFGACSLRQGKCQIFAWSPKGASRKPFYLGGGYDKVDFGFFKLTNYCKYNISYDCSGFTLDEFSLLDMDKIDFSSILGELYTPITTDMQLNMQDKVKQRANTMGSDLGGTTTFDSNGNPESYEPPANSGPVGGGVSVNGAALIVDKPYCKDAPCSVNVTMLRYLQDQYYGQTDSPTNGGCYPLSIQLDWGDSSQESVINPAATFADAQQCKDAQTGPNAQPYPTASHTFQSPGVYDVIAHYTDPYTGNRYSAKVVVHVDSTISPDPYSKGVPEGNLVKE